MGDDLREKLAETGEPMEVLPPLKLEGGPLPNPPPLAVEIAAESVLGPVTHIDDVRLVDGVVRLKVLVRPDKDWRLAVDRP